MTYFQEASNLFLHNSFFTLFFVGPSSFFKGLNNAGINTARQNWTRVPNKAVHTL